MEDFKEKYKNLYESVKDVPARNLKVISTEERGDDLSTHLYRSFENTDLHLFLLSENTAENGFVESYCLDEESLKRIKIIRKKKEENPKWRENLILALEDFLHMPYEKFKKISLGHQQMIIDEMKKNLTDEEIERFDQKFSNLSSVDKKTKDLKMNL